MRPILTFWGSVQMRTGCKRQVYIRGRPQDGLNESIQSARSSIDSK